MTLDSVLKYFTKDEDESSSNSVWNFYSLNDGYAAKYNDGYAIYLNISKDDGAILIGDDSDSIEIDPSDINNLKIFKLVEVEDE